ncbi:hypothetical protein HPP92_001706 [Vanilla planifolia]|uniref:ELMO domain-containing protein n=1 Tax=Vanilla planifolia TaxID=51239 RepID=A0A835RR58_VANPL|nr:hypothetical protein HPP92_001706 [Vanilla planifolia]
MLMEEIMSILILWDQIPLENPFLETVGTMEAFLRKKQILHWTYLFSQLVSQWAQWLENIALGSRSILERIFPFPAFGNGRHGDEELPSVLSPIQEERLQNLKQRLEIPFDGSCDDHQESLRQLWRLAYPDRSIPALKSEQWKEMGWQGPDPSTDFRYQMIRIKH